MIEKMILEESLLVTLAQPSLGQQKKVPPTFSAKLNHISGLLNSKSVLYDKGQLNNIYVYLKTELNTNTIEEFDSYCVKLFSSLTSIYKEIKDEIGKSPKNFIENLILSTKLINGLTTLFFINFNRLEQTYNDKQKTIIKGVANFLKIFVKATEELSCIKVSQNNEQVRFYECLSSFFLVCSCFLNYFSSNMRCYEQTIKKVIESVCRFNSEIPLGLKKSICMTFSLMLRLSVNESEKMSNMFNECNLVIAKLNEIAIPRSTSSSFADYDKLEIELFGEKQRVSLKGLSNRLILQIDLIKESFRILKAKQVPIDVSIEKYIQSLKIIESIEELHEIFSSKDKLSNGVIGLIGLSAADSQIFLSELLHQKIELLKFFIDEFESYVHLSSFNLIESILRKMILKKLVFVRNSASLILDFASLFNFLNRVSYYWVVQEDFFIKFVCSDFIKLFSDSLNSLQIENSQQFLQSYLVYLSNFVRSPSFVYYSENTHFTFISLVDFIFDESNKFPDVDPSIKLLILNLFDSIKKEKNVLVAITSKLFRAIYGIESGKESCPPPKSTVNWRNELIKLSGKIEDDAESVENHNMETQSENQQEENHREPTQLIVGQSFEKMVYISAVEKLPAIAKEALVHSSNNERILNKVSLADAPEIKKSVHKVDSKSLFIGLDLDDKSKIKENHKIRDIAAVSAQNINVAELLNKKRKNDQEHLKTPDIDSTLNVSSNTAFSSVEMEHKIKSFISKFLLPVNSGGDTQIAEIEVPDLN